MRAGLLAADRFGNAGASARWLRFERLHIAYWEGRWDEALQLIENSLSEVGPSHALSRWNFEMRGRIRLARDDVAGALDDAEQSLKLGREAKDPQTLYPALSFAAVALLEGGRRDEAERSANELLALGPADHPIPNHVFLFDLAWVLAELDRSDELVDATERAAIRTPHIEAAEALARGDYLHAANVYAGMGARPNEAYTRLRTAARLVDEGRRAEADEQLRRALPFWRLVKATRYIREAESLLAATA